MTIKAVRAQIKLGDVDLDVFQMPDGSYSFSSTGIAELLGLSSDKRVRQILLSKSLKPKTAMALKFGISDDFKLVLPKVSADVGNINAVSMELFMLIVNYEAFANDNKMASAVLEAALVEALERRADAAFGKQVTEEERNAKLALRAKSKVTRRKYTDVLKERMVEHIGEERYKSIASGFFRNATIQVNQHLYNQPHFSCDRDNMAEDQLSDIELFERQLERRAIRFPEHTAEELLAWMLENY